MVATIGLTGLRPDPARVSRIASPPYDVIKPGTPLEKLLNEEPSSLFHIILGDDPGAASDRLVADGSLIEDNEPAYYVYEQTWRGAAERACSWLQKCRVTTPSRSSVMRRPSTTR